MNHSSQDKYITIAIEDLDFLDAIETPEHASDSLTGDTVLGRPTNGKAHGKASDLLESLDPGVFHKLGVCPFHPEAPSPKGKDASVAVDAKRTRLTLTCWAVDEHDHGHGASIRTSTDGRSFAAWSWGPNAKAQKDVIPTDDQSYLADHVLKVLEAKNGLLALRGEDLMVYDNQQGQRSGGKLNAGCSPTWGSWVPYPRTLLLESVRRTLSGLSVRTESKDGVEGSRPVRITVRLVEDVLTLALRTMEVREHAYLDRIAKAGAITHDERGEAKSRFDLCSSTLLNPGTVLTGEAKQVVARPDHHVPSEARVGFAPDTRFAKEWAAYVGQMIPDEMDQKAVKMWVGAALVGGCATKLQQHVILQGPPGTGKSQLLELIASLFPPAQRAAVPLSKLGDRFSSVGLIGKRLNLSPEADKEDGRLPEVGQLKLMLDGGEVQVERKHQQPIWARISCAHLIAANELPSGGAGGAQYDRFRIIRATTVRIRRTDTDIKEWWKSKLQWRPAILAWAIEGLTELNAAKWRLPTSVSSTEAEEEWREGGDSVFAWVRSLPAPPADDAREHWAPASAAYAHYAAWCKAEGREPVKNPKFGTRVKDLVGHTRTGGRAYQVTITRVDDAVDALFPTIPTVEQQIQSAWDRQDVAGLAALVEAHPAAAKRVLFGGVR